ncbi:MAG: four helix bundle protein [Flavobacteriaceae bacterium]
MDSKLTDSDGENSETQVWLEFANSYDYISEEECAQLTDRTEEVGKLLNYMINNLGKFGVKKD